MRKTIKHKDRYISMEIDYSNQIVGTDYDAVQLKDDAVRFYRFDTGSSGNMNVLAFRNTVLVLDCGVGTTRFKQNMESIGDPEISAILVSHAHNDHRNESNFGDNLIIDESNYKNIGAVGDIQLELFLLPHGEMNSMACVFTIYDDKYLWFTDTGNIAHIPRYNYKKIFGEIDYDRPGLRQAYDDGVYPKSLVQRIINDHTSYEEVLEFCDNRNIDFNTVWYPLHMSNNSLTKNFNTSNFVLIN